MRDQFEFACEILTETGKRPPFRARVGNVLHDAVTHLTHACDTFCRHVRGARGTCRRFKHGAIAASESCESLSDALYYAVPVSPPVLAKEPHRGIPGAVLAIEEPSEIDVRRYQEPH